MTSEHDRDRIAAARVLHPPFCPVEPTPTQARFLLDPSKETLYGGAAGGGKSIAMLMAALAFVDVPGYAAIIFRPTLTALQLPSGLMSVARSWFDGTEARWSAGDHTWTFPSGATLSFGYLDHDGAELRYQGSEFQFIGFDELTQFTERQYTYLFSRLRRAADPTAPLAAVPLRMRSTTNPGGPGHEWVFQRFIAPWRRHLDAGTCDLKRWFYPATLADNPFLDDGYRDGLDQLDLVTRLQLRDGDWDIRPEGHMFQRKWFPIIRATEIPEGCRWVRTWDFAATEASAGTDPDYTVGILVGHHRPSGVFFVHDIVRFRGSPAAVEQGVRKTAEADGRAVEIHLEEEGGSAGKAVTAHYIRDVLAGYVVKSTRPTGSKTVRAAPLAASAEWSYVHLVGAYWNEDLLAELEVFPVGAHDDQVDALAAAHIALTAKREYPLVSPVAIPKDPNRDRWPR